MAVLKLTIQKSKLQVKSERKVTSYIFSCTQSSFSLYLRNTNCNNDVYVQQTKDILTFIVVI